MIPVIHLLCVYFQRLEYLYDFVRQTSTVDGRDSYRVYHGRTEVFH